MSTLYTNSNATFPYGPESGLPSAAFDELEVDELTVNGPIEGGASAFRATTASLAPGGTLAVAHDADAENKRITHAAGRAPRSLSLTFPSNDPARYDYSSPGEIGVTTGALALEKVGAPAGLVRLLEFGTPGAPSPPHLFFRDSLNPAITYPASSGVTQVDGIPALTDGGGFPVGSSTESVSLGAIDPEVDIAGVDGFSLSVWIYVEAPTPLSGSRRIVTNRAGGGTSAGIELRLNGSRVQARVQHDIDEQSTQTPAGFMNTRANQWVHIAVTWTRGGDLRLVTSDQTAFGVDDRSDASPTGTVLNNPGTLLTVGNFAATGQQFEGRIDQVAFYSTVLTTEEILYIYNSAQGRILAGFVSGETRYANTNGLSRINTSAFPALSSIGASVAEDLADTFAYFALSWDAGVTWRSRRTGVWLTVADLADLDTEGMSAAQLVALTSAQIAEDYVAGTLDLAIGLVSADPLSTPSVTSLSFAFSSGSVLTLAPSEVAAIFTSATSTSFMNLGTDSVTDLVASVLLVPDAV